jgi:hypothetical protein
VAQVDAWKGEDLNQDGLAWFILVRLKIRNFPGAVGWSVKRLVALSAKKGWYLPCQAVLVIHHKGETAQAKPPYKPRAQEILILPA